MQVFLDTHRHVYLQVQQVPKKRSAVYLTLNGRINGVSTVKLTDREAAAMGLQVRDISPLRVAIVWARSPHPKTSLAGSWIDKILDECPATEDDSSFLDEGDTQMFYIIGKAGVLHGVASTKKEVESDFDSMDESERLESIIATSPEDLAGALTGAALLALGNSDDVLKGGPEFTKFKSKADGAKQVWDVLEQGHNPKLIKEAEKAAAAKAKADAKAAAEADKAAAKAARSAEKSEKVPKAEGGTRTSRNSWAGKAIRKLAAHSARAGTKRAALLDAVLAAKKTDDVLGKLVSYEGGEAPVTSADLKFAVGLGLVEVA